MSLNDPYFDDWVRDKINLLEAKTPDHLWDAIRNSSRFYIIVDRNKYLLTLLVLLTVTGTVGYWAFHPKSVHLNNIVATNVPVIPATNASMKPPTLPGAPLLGGSHTAPGGTTTEAAVGNNTAASAVISSQAVDNAPIGVPSTHVDELSTSGAWIATRPPETGENGQQDAGANDAFATAPTTNEQEAISNKALRLAAQEPNAALLSKPTLGTALNKSTGIATPAGIREHSRRKIYWEAFAGPDHVVHYIKATSTQYEGYVRQVRATESSYPSFSMGLKADLPVLGENWRMQVGLRFSQINEELNYTYVQGNKTTLKYSFNTYRGLDLPILTSYTLIHSQQLEFKVSGGALFNLASWFRGDVLDTNYQPMALHIKDESKGTPQSTVWKNSIGTSLYSSVTLYDQVFPKVQVGIEPYLRYELSPVNRAVSVYTERFVTTGLMFNIRFQLGQ